MSPHSSPTPAYPIESVGRALRLLTLVAERGSVSVTAAAEHLDVARSTAHRMLATLVAEDFVRQDPVTKAYGPGRGMLELGLSALRNLDVRAAARPELEALRDELGETAHVVLLEGTHILFVDSVESARAVRVGSRIGHADGRALHRGGQGDPCRRCRPTRSRSTSPRCPPGLTPNSLTEREDGSAAEIAESVADRGWATNFEESEDGLSAVAAAIAEPSGARCARRSPSRCPPGASRASARPRSPRPSCTPRGGRCPRRLMRS